jgi:hypothetical protein
MTLQSNVKKNREQEDGPIGMGFGTGFDRHGKKITTIKPIVKNKTQQNDISTIPLNHCTVHPYLLAHQNHISKKATAIMDTTTLWKNSSTLDVQFLDYPTKWEQWQKAWVAYIITTTIMVYANINFVFHIDSSTIPRTKICEIRISCDQSQGCYSLLGTYSLLININPANVAYFNSMNIGWFDAPFSYSFTVDDVSYTTPSFFYRGGYDGAGGSIIHEFGHALGMKHELQSPFQNNIQWNKNVVYKYFADKDHGNWSKEIVDYNILDPISHVGLNGSAFDRYSIMKYVLPSSLLLNPTLSMIKDIEQFNNTLSSCDQYWLAHNYPGRNVTVSCPLSAYPDNNVVPVPTPVPASDNTSKNNTILIIIIVVGCILFIGGMIYFFYRKKS